MEQVPTSNTKIYEGAACRNIKFIVRKYFAVDEIEVQQRRSGKGGGYQTPAPCYGKL